MNFIWGKPKLQDVPPPFINQRPTLDLGANLKTSSQSQYIAVSVSGHVFAACAVRAATAFDFWGTARARSASGALWAHAVIRARSSGHSNSRSTQVNSCPAQTKLCLKPEVPKMYVYIYIYIIYIYTYIVVDHSAKHEEKCKKSQMGWRDRGI